MSPAEEVPMLEVEVVNETGMAVDEEVVARAVLWILEREQVAVGVVAVAFVEEAAMAELNGRYRAGVGATDVLSFPGGAGDDPDWPEPDAEAEAPPHLGDIVICPAVAERNAAEDGHGPAEELRRLLVHGVLHLLDYDHEVDQGEMRERESEILADPSWEIPPLLSRG
ncbi:MAG: rRNA maturation RNase YbeY [Thermoleophilia bacterium]